MRAFYEGFLNGLHVAWLLLTLRFKKAWKAALSPTDAGVTTRGGVE